MLKRKVDNLVIKEISEIISKYFPVHSQRIYNLIYQIKSIDDALYLLMIHKNSAETLDVIVYDYLKGKEEKRYV